LTKWLNENGFEVKVQTGIRVFHDYMAKNILEETDNDRLMELEYRYCKGPVYKDMGRYIHILAQKTKDF